MCVNLLLLHSTKNVKMKCVKKVPKIEKIVCASCRDYFLLSSLSPSRHKRNWNFKQPLFPESIDNIEYKEALIVVFTFSSQRRTNQRPRNPDVSYTQVSAFDPAKASPSGLWMALHFQVRTHHFVKQPKFKIKMSLWPPNWTFLRTLSDFLSCLSKNKTFLLKTAHTLQCYSAE